MRLLVVGASGFLGGTVLRTARQAGWETAGTFGTHPCPDLIEFNLLSVRVRDRIPPEFFRSSERTCAVICASICQIDRCKREANMSRIVNVDSTIQLIDDLVALGVKPVFLSTGFVFDGTVGYYTESHPRCPNSEYGRQKAAVESYLEEKVPSAAILRLDRPVSDDPLKNHLFSQWRRSLKETNEILCIAGQVFAPTLDLDIARAILLTAERDLRGIYHVANTEFFERAELARQFISECGLAGSVISKDQETFRFDDPRPLKSYLDSTKFISATGFRFTSMRETIRRFHEKSGSVGAQ